MNLVVFSTQALDFNWFKLIYEANKKVLNIAVDSIEDSLAKAMGGQSRAYQVFKKKSDAIQEEIAQELDKITVANKESELEKANQLFKKLREQEDALLLDAQKSLNAAEYQALAHTIKTRQVVAAQKIKSLSTLKIIANLAEGLRIKAGFKISPVGVNAKELVQSANPLGISLVSKQNELSFYEKLYLKNREPKVKKALQDAIGYKGAEHPLLGFVGTGGGYRAMILSTGYCSALKKLGLLDGISYITSLSGSTWFLAPWIVSGLSINEFQDALRKKIEQGRFDLKSIRYQLSSQVNAIVNNILWPKFIYAQPIGSVDLFGALLAFALLSPFELFTHQQPLSAQLKKVISGEVPFPIYTAVSMHNVEGIYRYHWYEFNPLFIRNLELQLSVPSNTFGSSFYQGYLKAPAPEQSLGFLLAIFGSAYTVNLKDIDRMLKYSVAQEQKTLQGQEKVKYYIVEQILDVMQDLSLLGTARFSPGQVVNPFYGYTPSISWLNERILLTFVDGGIDYNIPIRPLALPERGMRALIIGESSGNVPAKDELYKAFTDLKRLYGYEYTQVNIEGSSTVQFYKDLKHPHAPKLVYVTYMKDEDLFKKAQDIPELQELIQKMKLADFDPVKCVKDEACNTFNFSYTLDEFNHLVGIAEFNILANKERILQFLKEAFE